MPWTAGRNGFRSKVVNGHEKGVGKSAVKRVWPWRVYFIRDSECIMALSVSLCLLVSTTSYLSSCQGGWS